MSCPALFVGCLDALARNKAILTRTREIIIIRVYIRVPPVPLNAVCAREHFQFAESFSRSESQCRRIRLDTISSTPMMRTCVITDEFRMANSSAFRSRHAVIRAPNGRTFKYGHDRSTATAIPVPCFKHKRTRRRGPDDRYEKARVHAWYRRV